jgi:RNA polymerase sigma-70 factor (ECF subfamily)
VSERRLVPPRTWEDGLTVQDRSNEPAALAQRIHAGDASAERLLVERFSRGVRAILRHATREAADVDDLYQETFRIALERIRDGAVREPSQLAGFIAALARNLAIEHFRRGRHISPGNAELLNEMEAPGQSPLDSIAAGEQAECVRRVLEELPVQRDREVLRRYYLTADDKDGICRDFGLSRLQLNRVLFRARERFREHWLSQQAPAGKGTR